MQKISRHTASVWAAVGAFMIFGFSFMFSSIGLSAAKPTVMLSCRFTVAVLTMLVIIAVNALVGRVRGKAWFTFSLKGKPLGKLILLGIIQPVLYLIFESYGILYTSSAVAGTVLAVVPVVCILVDVLISHEKVTRMQVICAVACVFGVILVEGGGEARMNLIGFFCLLMTLASDVGYYALSHKVARQFNTLEVTFVMFFMGMVVFVPVALVQGRGHMAELFLPAVVTPSFWGAVLFLGAVSSVGGYALLNFSNATLTTSEASLIGNITTVVSVLAGVLILHDSFTPVQAAGVVVILAFVTLANLRGRK